MFNLWQNSYILTARAWNKDWGSDLSTPSELMHEKSWLLKDVYIRQPGSLCLDSIFLCIIIYQNTPVRIYLGECPRGYTKLFLLHFPTGEIKAVTPLPWSKYDFFSLSGSCWILPYIWSYIDVIISLQSEGLELSDLGFFLLVFFCWFFSWKKIRYPSLW